MGRYQLIGTAARILRQRRSLDYITCSSPCRRTKKPRPLLSTRVFSGFHGLTSRLTSLLEADAGLRVPCAVLACTDAGDAVTVRSITGSRR